MKRTHRWLSSFVLVCCAPVLSAQAAPKNALPPLPKNPSALMQLAWQENGLHGDDLKPWHVRATWQILDNKGKPEKQGTWEEWWAGPHESKTVYDSPDSQQTHWTTTKGDFSLEGQDSGGWLQDFVRDMIVNPVPGQSELGQSPLKISDIRDHGVRLHCVADDKRPREFCFDPDMVALRASANGVLQITMNSVAKFQGRYLATDMYVSRIGMPAIQIHLDKIEALAAGAERQLAPPPQAKLIAPAVNLAAGLTAGRRLSGKVPQYPVVARGQHVQGTVLIWAVIGQDGALHNLEIVGGPPMLQRSALDAVKTWRYKPYLVNGEPIEVHTQIDVTYRLGQ